MKNAQSISQVTFFVLFFFDDNCIVYDRMTTTKQRNVNSLPFVLNFARQINAIAYKLQVDKAPSNRWQSFIYIHTKLITNAILNCITGFSKCQRRKKKWFYTVWNNSFVSFLMQTNHNIALINRPDGFLCATSEEKQ